MGYGLPRGECPGDGAARHHQGSPRRYTSDFGLNDFSHQCGQAANLGTTGFQYRSTAQNSCWRVCIPARSRIVARCRGRWPRERLAGNHRTAKELASMNSSIPCDVQSLELALLYDEKGKLTDVLECSGLFDSVPFGTSLETLMDSGSLEKGQRFLSLIQAQGAAFDWEMNVRIDDAIRHLHFAGAKCGDRILLVGATSRAAVSSIFERVASKRGFPKWAAGSARTDPGQPDD